MRSLNWVVRVHIECHTVVALVLLASFAVPLNAQVTPTHGLIGKWAWTRPKNNCVEAHEYRADGTRFVTNGEERTESRYSMSGPTEKGFLKLSVTTTKDHGGRDCGGDSADDTGSTWSVYFRMHPSGQGVLFCYEESLRDCYGSFRRIGR